MSTRTGLCCGKWMRLWGPMFVACAAIGLVAFTEPAAGEHPGQGGRPFEVFMTGAAEAPGPGHPVAEGTAQLQLNPGQGEVCFFIEFEGIDPDDSADLIRAGHIHLGPVGQSGPVVVSFQITGSVPVDDEGRGVIEGCVSADRDLIRDIIKNPGKYYVNLHSQNFGPGAIRGQLSK